MDDKVHAQPWWVSSVANVCQPQGQVAKYVQKVFKRRAQTHRGATGRGGLSCRHKRTHTCVFAHEHKSTPAFTHPYIHVRARTRIHHECVNIHTRVCMHACRICGVVRFFATTCDVQLVRCGGQSARHPPLAPPTAWRARECVQDFLTHRGRSDRREFGARLLQTCMKEAQLCDVMHACVGG